MAATEVEDVNYYRNKSVTVLVVAADCDHMRAVVVVAVERGYMQVAVVTEHGHRQTVVAVADHSYTPALVVAAAHTDQIPVTVAVVANSRRHAAGLAGLLAVFVTEYIQVVSLSMVAVLVAVPL